MKSKKTWGMNEEKENGGKKIGARSVGDMLKKLCHVGVYLFLFFFVIVYVFYAPKGYIQIATNKYQFFRRMAIVTGAVMVPLMALQYLFSVPGKKQGRSEKSSPKKTSLSLTDVFMLLFLAINCVSFLFTEYREEASWGTSGWYMGFAMMLSFMGIYFMLSRFYDGKIDLLMPLMAVTSVVFLWGLLNRFSVYPVDMQHYDPSFISCIGNINWFCGYWSVFFGVGVVLYLVTERSYLRIFSAIAGTLALAVGAVEGSDSAFVSMGVVFFFLFLIAFRKTAYMKRLLDMGIFYCAACQVMRIAASFGPETLPLEEGEWAGLNLSNPVIEKMLGNPTLAALALLVMLRILLELGDKKYRESGGVGNDSAKGQFIRRLLWIKYAVVGVTTAAAAVYLILLIINTRTPGILGPLSRYRVLLFDGNWGSNRGATWRDGMLIYQTLSWRERLFGVGQDCFSIYAYSVPEIAARLAEEWPGSRLTNAHNECITFLVNLGIFGLLSFIGIFFSSVRRLLERAKEEPLCYVFAASLLSYFFHNQFSFSQVMNIPYIFMMLGLAENLLRRERREEPATVSGSGKRGRR